MFSIFPYVSLCICNAVTFESLDLQSLFLVCRYTFRIARSSSSVRVRVTGAKNHVVCVSVQAVSFECADLECLFFVSLEYLGQVCISWLRVKVKVTGAEKRVCVSLLQVACLQLTPSPSLDNIRVMVIVWRLRGNIIRTAPCWVV